MTQYPTLEHFFGAYMHQDWHDDYADEWEAVDGLHRGRATGGSGALRAEVALLLTRHPSEEEVRKIVLDDLESCYLAEVDGWKYRDWLQALSDHAAKAMGHRRAS